MDSLSPETNGQPASAAGLRAAHGSDELVNLRRRVKEQRRELRRLNKEMAAPKAAYWWGFRKGLDAHAESELRLKMNKAFGYKVVWEAEHGEPYPERNHQNAELRHSADSAASQPKKTNDEH